MIKPPDIVWTATGETLTRERDIYAYMKALGWVTVWAPWYKRAWWRMLKLFGVALVLLAACTATSSPPTPDAELACHRVEAACPADMQAYSCFTGSACVFPGEPGAQNWVCCP